MKRKRERVESGGGVWVPPPNYNPARARGKWLPYAHEAESVFATIHPDPDRWHCEHGCLGTFGHGDTAPHHDWDCIYWELHPTETPF